MEELLLAQNQSDIWDEEYRYNLKNRILILNSDITNGVIEDYVHFIMKWNREDKDIPIKKRKPITLIINSFGGDVFSGQGLINVILMSKTKVRTIGIGMVGSDAYLIFLAGDKRYSFADTTYLMHDGAITIENSTSKARQTADFFDKMEERVKQYILERTSIDEEFYDEVYDREYWMYPQEAKELGIVDAIIGEDCDLDEILD